MMDKFAKTELTRRMREVFGNRQRFACQRTQCTHNKKEVCYSKLDYPCREVLPTYLLQMFDRAVEIAEKDDDPNQKKLGEF
jgi:hypothetical protein